jgi:hypothetical protein
MIFQSSVPGGPAIPLTPGIPGVPYIRKRYISNFEKNIVFFGLLTRSPLGPA